MELERKHKIQVRNKKESVILIIPVSENEIWVADDRDRNLILIDGSGRVIKESADLCDKDSFIYDAKKYGNDILATCYLVRKILRLSGNGETVSSFYDTSPYITMGLCVTDNQQVLLCLKSGINVQDERAKVIKIDSKGQELLTISSESANILPFFWPDRLIALKDDITIVVNDTSPNILLFFNKEGRKIREWNGYVGKKPVHIAYITHNNGKLYMTDKNAKKVYVMNTDATGARCLIDGTKEDLLLPSGIAFNHGQLLVGSWDGTITIFEYPQDDIRELRKRKPKETSFEMVKEEESIPPAKRSKGKQTTEKDMERNRKETRELRKRKTNETSPEMVKEETRELRKRKAKESTAEMVKQETELSRNQIEEYLEAISGCEDGKARNIRIMLVGNKGTGKTCLCKNLQKENISSDLPSTDGIDVYIQRFVVNMETKEFSKQPERSEHDTTLNKIRATLYQMKTRENNQDISHRESNNSEHSTSKRRKTNKKRKKKEPNQTPRVKNDPTQEKTANDKAAPRTGRIDSIQKTKAKTNDPLSSKDKKNSDDSSKIGSHLSDAFLKEHFSDLHRAYTTQKEGEELGDNKSYASFWDFGGETDYYNTHHIFLTSDAVYLLVFDLSTCMNSDKWIEEVTFWLQSIATLSNGNATDTGSGTPPIIIVGTHLDKLQEKFKEEEEVNKEIERIQHCLFGKKVAQTIILRQGIGIYSVSNLRPDDDVFTKIWDGILSSADKQSQWEKELPGWWLERERVIMKKKSEGVKVLKFEEIRDIDRTLPSFINKLTDVEMFLRHMHLTGNIIVSNNENLENAYIIIDSQWLVHAFSRLITPPKIQDRRIRGRDGILWDIYEKTAELKMELVNLAWEKNKSKSERFEDSENFLDYKDVLLKIMETFSLIAPLKNENDEGSEQRIQQENTTFIVPCKLPEATPDILQTVSEQANVLKTPTLCFAFRNDFVPFSVYDKIITSCIQRFEPLENITEKEKIVQRGFICLRLRHVWNMIICCKNAVMKVTLFRYSPREREKPEPGVGHPIRKILEDLLQRVWSISHEDKLQYTIEFHNDYRVREREIRIAAADLRDGNGQRCAGVQSAEEYLKKEHYNIWFSTSVKSSDVSGSEELPGDLSTAQLQSQLTEKQIALIVKYINSDYYMFFIDLGLQFNTIETIQIDSSHLNSEDMYLKMLHKWRNLRGKGASVAVVLRAMKKHFMKYNDFLVELGNVA